MAKHIFVTGGVVSSLGKGLTAASIGMILEHRGLRVMLQKLDPYLNVDPGTMSPYQHGEVYVLADGSETDLDLGHYERFTNAVLNRNCNFTTGKIYQSVIEKERGGDYLGSTVQVIPHVTDEIQEAVETVVTDDVDVVITEIGGTVGDIESLPFLEAIRQFALKRDPADTCFIHLTLLPYLRASGEMKTKPTQHSVGRLREIGIQPQILICRTERALTREMREKISLFCNVRPQAVLEERDVEVSIYEVPQILLGQGLDRLLVDRLALPAQDRPDWSAWDEMLERVRHPEHEVEIAVVGKYIQLNDAYKSIYESLTHGGIANHARVRVRKVQAEELERVDPEERLAGVHGVLVPGGFGERGIEGKIRAVRWAREGRVPYLGICLGLQCAAIEFARDVLGLEGAHSTEFRAAAADPVIHLLASQKGVSQKGGTMRLGAYPCELAEESRAREAYGVPRIEERHRHRFEFNNRYREAFASHGMVASGIYAAKDLVEILELRDHPWFVAVQFHPEFQSKPTRAHPLFASFVEATLQACGAGRHAGAGA